MTWIRTSADEHKGLGVGGVWLVARQVNLRRFRRSGVDHCNYSIGVLSENGRSMSKQKAFFCVFFENTERISENLGTVYGANGSQQMVRKQVWRIERRTGPDVYG